MAFDVQHGPPSSLTGINALLVGLDQERRNTRQQNIANDMQVNRQIGQGITGAATSIFGAATQRFQAEQAQERIRLNDQLDREAATQSNRERAIGRQVQEANRLLQMPPHAAAEVYSNTQEIARLAADNSLPEFDQRQMIDAISAQNEAIIAANPPPTPPTILDDERSGQIKFYPDQGVMLAPKKYAIRSLPSMNNVKFSDWMDAVNDEQARLMGEGMSQTGAGLQAQENINQKFQVFRESRGQPTTGDVDKPLITQARRKFLGSTPDNDLIAAGAATRTFGAVDPGAGQAGVGRPQDDRQAGIDAGNMAQLDQTIAANVQGLRQLIGGLSETLGVDKAQDLSTWSGQTMAQAVPMAQRIQRFTLARYPTVASLNDLSRSEKEELASVARLAQLIIGEANKRAQEGVTGDEQNSNR